MPAPQSNPPPMLSPPLWYTYEEIVKILGRDTSSRASRVGADCVIALWPS